MAGMGSSLRQHSPVAIADAAVTNGAIQKPRELAEFISLIIGLEPQVIVEIGVHVGGTLYAWQQIAPTVMGVDWAPDGPHVFDLDGSTVVLGNSHETKTFLAVEKCLDGRPIDCLFIDGDHSYVGVRQDYRMYSPLVRRGGVIAFHDIAPILQGQTNVDDIQVKRFWDEIKDESAVEIIDTDDHLRSHIAGFGIGVLTHAPERP
jgi:cephalosporin hydroxylase